MRSKQSSRTLTNQKPFFFVESVQNRARSQAVKHTQKAPKKLGSPNTRASAVNMLEVEKKATGWLIVWFKSFLLIDCCMKEIEAKFLEIDKRAMEKKLLSFGAKKVFSGTIETVLFDFPDKRIWNSGCLLRLRKKGNLSELTFKKKLVGKKAKVAIEQETIVEDFSATIELLKGIGLVETEKFSKKRISFSFGKAHVELDKLDGVPWFLEIEAGNEKEIEKTAKKLGLSIGQAKPWTRSDVLKHYGLLK
jgi:predicted adenylyl cyclase CyaB